MLKTRNGLAKSYRPAGKRFGVSGAEVRGFRCRGSGFQVQRFGVSGAEVRGFRCNDFGVSRAAHARQVNKYGPFQKRNTRAFLTE